MVMHAAYLVSVLAWCASVSATSGNNPFNKRFADPVRHHHSSRKPNILRRQNTNASAFTVDGSSIPDVDFDLGESYAGLLPVSERSNETDQLYFWYFPSTSADAGDEITIWCKLCLCLMSRLVTDIHRKQ
jgi:carboxypeptidase D